MADIKPGQLIRFFGGWEESEFSYHGIIIEPYRHAGVLLPDLWMAHLETGSYVVGYTEQYERLDGSEHIRYKLA